MKNKTILKLLGAFHICLFLILAGYKLSIFSQSDYFDDFKQEETIVELIAEPAITLDDVTEVNTETETETETEAAQHETIPDDVTKVNTETETAETEPAPVYFNGFEVPFHFQFSGRSRLNIRSGPSMESAIIGKIPKKKIGTVIDVYDDEWVKVSFEGIEGYCSTKWITIIMEENN